MSNRTRITLSIISVLAILNVMFVPVFSIWGGLFADESFMSFLK